MTLLETYYLLSLSIPYFWLILGGALGLSIGSFINAAAYRIPLDRSLLSASACPICKEKIPPYDNVPLLSYLLLKGKCRQCHARISAQYPAVEVLGGVIGIFSLWYIGGTYGFILFIIALLVLYLYAVFLTHGNLKHKF